MDVSADISDLPPDMETEEVYAPGDSALEVAARRGFGPLSPLNRQVWHGHSRPCVSCGQLVPADTFDCPDCGQDLRAEMVERMRAHAGPWYVHEHVRPFPGVTLERLVRQIRRGVLTPTTIVRGPTTDHQWRFAAQTPGLSKYLSVCWRCQGRVDETDMICNRCGVDLNGGYRLRPIEPPGPAAAPVPAPVSPAAQVAVTPRPQAPPPTSNWPAPAVSAPPIGASSELAALSAALAPAAREPSRGSSTVTPRVGGIPAWWIVAALLLGLLAVMIVIINQRAAITARPSKPERPIPALKAPVSELPLPPARSPESNARIEQAPTSSPAEATPSGPPAAEDETSDPPLPPATEDSEKTESSTPDE